MAAFENQKGAATAFFWLSVRFAGWFAESHSTADILPRIKICEKDGWRFPGVSGILAVSG